MEVNYSDKELENFTSKKSSPQDKMPTPKKINYTPSRPPAPSRQAASFQHSIPQQKPQKEIAPPQNIPNIAPPQQNIPLQTPSAKPKFSYPKLELNFKKPAVIGILTAAVIFIFILIASRIFLGGGTYSALEKFLLYDKYPPEVHSNVEFYVKFKNSLPFLLGFKENNWLSNLSAFVSQPPVPLPPNAIDNFSSVENPSTAPDENTQEDFTPPFILQKKPAVTSPENIEIRLNIISDQKTTADRLNIEKLKSSINLNFNLDALKIGGVFDVLFNHASNALYLKISRFSPSEILPDNFTNFLNQWIKVDFNQVLQSLPPEYQNEFLKSFEENLQKNKELENEIIRFIKGKKVQNLVAIRGVKSEKINNAEAYHYTLSLKKDFLKDLLNIFSKAVATGLSQTMNSGLPLPEFNLNELLKDKEFNALLDKIEQLPFEIWFGKKDSLIYKFSLDLGKIGSIIAGSDIIDGYFKIEYADYGKDFSIEEPSNYKNLKEVLGQLELLGPGQQNFPAVDPLKKERNEKRINDINYMRLSLELYYNDTGQYPKTKKWTRLDLKNNPFEKALKKYLTYIPKDPLYPDFYYAYKSDGKKYELSARLEYYPEIKHMCDSSTNQICLYIIRN